MSPTPRAALLLGAVALAALLVPVPAGLALAGGALVVIGIDAVLARRVPRLRRTLPAVLSRGVPARLTVETDEASRDTTELRQPTGPDVRLVPAQGHGRLDAELVARRRGRHELPPVAARRAGPLRLGAWHFRGSGRTEVLVYPDVHAARALALAVRRGRFREPGRRSRGPLGLGTDFESIRDYLPDDDVRQINWDATARVGRPMSNQYRVEHDRDIVCLVDTGRLMVAPVGDRTRLDAMVDAVAAVALVADEVGDRAGVVAFDSEVRRSLGPRRSGGAGVVRAVFDLEPRPVDSDYEIAFRSVRSTKRSLVLVLTDLVDPAAARSLLDAVPVLARRHAVVVASLQDRDLTAAVASTPRRARDVYAAAVALDVLDARTRVAASLRRAGAEVVEAPPETFTRACVGAYLRLKDRARL